MATEKTYVSKLTVATIHCNPAKVVKAGEATPIAHIFGKASAIKIVSDKLTGQAYEALQGQFEAHNLETGEVFNSGVLYLPAGIHDVVLSQVKGLQNETDSIGFAMELCVVVASNPRGYSYEARDVMPPKLEDDLSEYRTLVTSRRQPLTLSGDTGKAVEGGKVLPLKGKKI
jgi:hypothetical protein